jgi:hypothetical protein
VIPLYRSFSKKSRSPHTPSFHLRYPSSLGHHNVTIMSRGNTAESKSTATAQNIHQPSRVFGCQSVLSITSSLDNWVRDNVVDARSTRWVRVHAAGDEIGQGGRQGG